MSYQPRQQNLSPLQPYQQKKFANYAQLSPMTKSPHNQRQNFAFTHENNTRQFVNTPAKITTNNLQKKPQTNTQQPLSNQPLSQTQSKTVINVNTQQGKKFTPLSYKNSQKTLQQQPDDKDKQYAKQTLIIVLIGFVILILIIGSFYSLMLWNKMKSEQSQNSSIVQSTITTNSNAANGTVKIQTENRNNQAEQSAAEWKTLPDDEQSPLGFLEQHQKNQQLPSHHSIYLRKYQSHSQNGNYFHRTNYQLQSI